MVDVFGFIRDIISPVTDLIDDLHTSDVEKLEAKAKLLAVQTAVANRMLDYEAALVAASRDTIVAEATSESWLTRTWRPITMLCFVAIVMYGYVSGTEIPGELWTVIQIGVGGYVGGRTIEKTVPSIIAALKSAEKT